MTAQDRRGWLVVAVMFLCITASTGIMNSTGVYVSSLLSYFGGSRARIASVMTIGHLTLAVTSVIIGWMLDRYDAKWLVGCGVISAGCGLLVASQSRSFPELIGAFLLFGIASGAAGMVPAALLVANWVPHRRALGLGLVLIGASVGATIIANSSTFFIAHFGWRWSYVLISLPVFLLVLPAVLVVIRTSPAGVATQGVGAIKRRDNAAAPGLDVAEALRARSFWLATGLFFLWSTYASVMVFHIVPFMTDLHYSAAQAALALSTWLVSGAIAKLIFGWLADYLGFKVVLTISMAGLAAGLLPLTASSSPFAIYTMVFVTGACLGPCWMLIPLLELDSFGLRRFGTLSGLSTVGSTVGGSLGVMAAGRIFDVYGSYRPAFVLLCGLAALGAVLPYLCVPFAPQAATEGVLESAEAG